MLRIVILMLMREWRRQGGKGEMIHGYSYMSFMDMLKDPRVTVEDIDYMAERWKERYGPTVNNLPSNE
jgi:hypothetical protein